MACGFLLDSKTVSGFRPAKREDSAVGSLLEQEVRRRCAAFWMCIRWLKFEIPSGHTREMIYCTNYTDLLIVSVRWLSRTFALHLLCLTLANRQLEVKVRRTAWARREEHLTSCFLSRFLTHRST